MHWNAVTFNALFFLSTDSTASNFHSQFNLAAVFPLQSLQSSNAIIAIIRYIHRDHQMQSVWFETCLKQAVWWSTCEIASTSLASNFHSQVHLTSEVFLFCNLISTIKQERCFHHGQWSHSKLTMRDKFLFVKCNWFLCVSKQPCLLPECYIGRNVCD